MKKISWAAFGCGSLVGVIGWSAGGWIVGVLGAIVAGVAVALLDCQ